jgi:Flp pilus assembly protein TadB
MDNIEHTRHNTESNKLKINHDCCRFSFLCFVFILFVSVLCPVYPMLSIHDCCRFCFLCFVFILQWVHKTQHGDKQNKNKTQKTKSATIMNGQHWVHKTQHGDKQNKNKTQKTKSAIMNGQHWVHVFCFYFLCLCVVSCVLNVVHSWLLPILFSVFCFYFVCLRDKENKNKIHKTKSATIMNGQHWVHKTQHGDKQNKNKTQKQNRQSWMEFSVFCFYFVCLRVVSCVLNVVHSWLLICFLRFVFILFASMDNQRHWQH